MHIIFHSYYQKYNENNLLFSDSQADIGDDLLSPFLSIAERANQRGISVSTFDQVSLDEASLVVFIELPRKADQFFENCKNSGLPLYLITLESPIIMQQNYEIDNHTAFKKVFTWNDDLIKKDSEKYIKINYSFNLPAAIPKISRTEKKLLTLISGNKKSSFPNELYSSRIKVIRYMEKEHPEDFDLFGLGWDNFIFGKSLPGRILNKIKIPRKLLRLDFESYRGSVIRKNTILKKYAFSLCYENASGISGYITEKIFDCFFAGCIPIYWGPGNILDYIPKNCFIDKRDFKSFDDVYLFISRMSESTYMEYINNIEQFLKSDSAYAFSNVCFSNTVLNEFLS